MGIKAFAQGAAEEAVQTAIGNADWTWVWLVIGLGASMSGLEAVGGFLMALGGATLAWKLGGDVDKRKYWLVVLAGLIVAYLAMLMHGPLTRRFDWEDIPVQVTMLVAGFGSKWVAGFAYDFFNRIGSGGKAAADRVLPREADE